MDENPSDQPVRFTKVQILIGILVMLAAFTPFFLTKYPVAGDYFLHLGRIDVLSRANDPFIALIYVQHWNAIPNLAFDVVGPLLGHLMSIVWVGKVFYILCGALSLTGAAAIGYALRRKPTAMMLVPAAILYNTVFVWGFLNYLFGIGLALWAFAIWIMLRKSKLWVQCAVFVPLGLAVFMCHLVAFGVFIFCAALYELGFFFTSESRREARPINFAAGALLTAIPAYLYIFNSPITESHVSATSPLIGKLRQLGYFFASGDMHAQAKLCFLIYGLLLLVFALRLLTLDRRMIPVLIGMLGLFFVSPSMVHGSAFLDMRMLMPLAFMFFNSCIISERLAKMAIPAYAVVALIFCYKTGIETKTWIHNNVEYARQEAVCAQIPDGSMLFSASDPDLLKEPSRPWWHSPYIASIGHEVFSSELFSDNASQPLWVRPAFTHIKDAQDQNDHIVGENPVETRIDDPKFLRTVRELASLFSQGVASLYPQAKTYVIYFWLNEAPPPHVDHLTEVGHGETFTLYRFDP